VTAFSYNVLTSLDAIKTVKLGDILLNLQEAVLCRTKPRQPTQKSVQLVNSYPFLANRHPDNRLYVLMIT